VKFRLTPHTKAILRGRGMCKDGRLLCAAANCLFSIKSPDPEFGREIKVRGYAICPRCKTKYNYPEDNVWDDRTQKQILRCKRCNRLISMKDIKWTQEVISRHYRNRHEYFHKECFDAMFLDVEDDDEIYWIGIKPLSELIRLVKWAAKA